MKTRVMISKRINSKNGVSKNLVYVLNTLTLSKSSILVRSHIYRFIFWFITLSRSLLIRIYISIQKFFSKHDPTFNTHTVQHLKSL